MKKLNGIYLFLFFAVIISNALAKVHVSMHYVTEIESNSADDIPPPCLVDAPRLWVENEYRCPILYQCQYCFCPQFGPGTCRDGTPTDEYGGCRVELWPQPGEAPCRVEWPRFPNGSCPEYLTCPNCPCYPGGFSGPCPLGMRADKHKHCRQVLY